MFSAAARRTSALPRTIITHNHHHQHAFSTRSIPTRPRSVTPITRTASIFRPSALQTRHLSLGQKMKRGYQEASKGIWRKNPILMPLALVSVATASGIFAYIAYVEATQVAPQYHKFPAPVAERLRTAIYYTDVDLNPHKAIKAYKEALHIAGELQMHPFSDEVMGIKLQVAVTLEKAGLVPKAIDVLEKIKADACHWTQIGIQYQADRGERPEDAKKGEEAAEPLSADPAILEAYDKINEIEAYSAQQLDKTLAKIVGISMKLAELYRSDYVQNDAKAEEALEFAVNFSLREMQRRAKAGRPLGGGNWMTLTEIATALTELGNMHYEKDQNNYALPLFLRALDLVSADEGKNPSCKQVTLMHNISAAIGSAAMTGRPLADPGVTREEAFETSRKWALEALNRAKKIPDDEDGECEASCALSILMLGELAAFQDKRGEATKYLTEAREAFKKLKEDKGVELTTEILKEVNSRK
ncbi:TPR domain protein [Aspergillus sclerotioniger CBS 115572]|uniref:TPR domain protein n=1 Tax=Aspergillus sclerotioniger CBS 115572 TaxID=1450535 RepID=A0A317XBZ1_9EURO|nr:TPR domain protein [Aspergillus sclerotioniger CBS 115572]PWY95202.1 TPR domain protein [Aspergillus sclerotioniger CBS 115572]